MQCPGCGADAARPDRGALPAMTPLHSHCLELDLHRLDLRFAGSRLVEPHAVARLAESIERCGQIVPCIVVAVPGGEGGGLEALVLIDGYRRVAALRRLGRDTAGVEQALLLRELVQGQGLSQHDVARRCGRDVSWVSRRLQLLSGLPDAALAAVRGGKLSSWAANRVVVPLARASAEHAERLLEALAGMPLTTRELRCWFERYQQAPRPARERMVSQAWLFIDTLRANEACRAGERLRDGPEGECLGDLRCLEAVIARLRKRVATLRPVPPPLIAAAPRLRAATDALMTALEAGGHA